MKEISENRIREMATEYGIFEDQGRNPGYYLFTDGIRAAIKELGEDGGGEKPIEVPKTAEEKAIEQYDSIEKIVTQLESFNYECEGGYLKNNVAFLALKKMTNLTTHE